MASSKYKHPKAGEGERNLSRIVESEVLPFLQANWLACHTFTDTDGRHDVSGLETMDNLAF